MKMTCRRCGKIYEGEANFGEPLPRCPECGSVNFPHPPIHFKGKGFYSTDWSHSRRMNTEVKREIGE